MVVDVVVLVASNGKQHHDHNHSHSHNHNHNHGHSPHHVRYQNQENGKWAPTGANERAQSGASTKMLEYSDVNSQVRTGGEPMESGVGVGSTISVGISILAGP